MITRQDAIDTLRMVADADILADDIRCDIEGIISCIEAELLGRHEWGVSSEDLTKLYGAVRSDLVTPDIVKEYDRVHRKLTFIPSIDERIVIESYITEEIENATGEEATGEDIREWFERP